MNRMLLSLLLAGTSVGAWATTGEGAASEKPATPYAVFVTTEAELARPPAPPEKGARDSAKDLRKHIEKKRGDWLRLVDTLEQAEVVIIVVEREETARHGAVLRSRALVLDMYDGSVIGQGALNGTQVIGVWRTAANDLSGRLQRLLTVFDSTLGEKRRSRARPAAVLLGETARARLEAGDVAGALAAWEEALGLSPDYGGALRARGQLLVAQGRAQEGLADLSRAIELKQADAATLLARARALTALGREDEADDDRRVVLAAVPRPAPITGSFAEVDEDTPVRRRVALELESRDRTLRLFEPLPGQEQTPDQGERLRQGRQAREILGAALAACEAGDDKMCEALSSRSITGVAELPPPPAPPPPRAESIDRARVNVRRANLRSGPATSEAVVRKLDGGDLLALIGREPHDGWYRVIHVASAEEGWIHGKLLDLELSDVADTERPSPFRGRPVAESGPPRVRVRNDADVRMTLTLGDERHLIPPGSTRTIELTAGSHGYVGAAPGVIPAIGSQSFEPGHEYDWRFWIVREPKTSP